MKRYAQIRAAMKRSDVSMALKGQWNGGLGIFSKTHNMIVGYLQQVLQTAEPINTAEMFQYLTEFTEANKDLSIMIRCEGLEETHFVVMAGVWFTIPSNVASNVMMDKERVGPSHYSIYCHFLKERATLALVLCDYGVADITESIIPNIQAGIVSRHLQAIQLERQYQGPMGWGSAMQSAHPGMMNHHNPYYRHR